MREVELLWDDEGCIRLLVYPENNDGSAWPCEEFQISAATASQLALDFDVWRRNNE